MTHATKSQTAVIHIRDVRCPVSPSTEGDKVRTLPCVLAVGYTVAEMSAIDKADPEWGRIVGMERQSVQTYIRGMRRNIKNAIDKAVEAENLQAQKIAAGERGERYVAPKRDTSAKAIAQYLCGIVEALPGKNKRAIEKNDATALDPQDCDKLVAYIKRLIK